MKFNFEKRTVAKKNRDEELAKIIKKENEILEKFEADKKDFEIDEAWDKKDEYEQRVKKREDAGEEIVAKMNRQKFIGVDTETLPYFETGEIREVFYTDENLKWFNREDFEAIIDDIKKDGTTKELEKAEKLLQREIKINELEEKARTSFRNMLKMEKGSGERVAAYEEWMRARKNVIDFEETSKNEIFEKQNMKYKVNDSDEIIRDNFKEDRPYIPGEVA